MDKELVKLAFRLGYGQAHVDLDKQAECQVKAMTSVKEKPVSSKVSRKPAKSDIQKKAEADGSQTVAKLAYRAGYEAGLSKQARRNPYQKIIRSEGTPENVERAIINTGGGALAGSIIAGEGRRGLGATVGSLSGLYLSNPKLFNALVGQLLHDSSARISKAISK
jgi:hypothetical protein